MKTRLTTLAFAALTLAASFTPIPARAAADALAPASATTVEERTTFANSVGAIPPRVSASGLRNPTPTELAGEIHFNVALKMRDLATLQTRIGRGELISDDELSRVFLPLPADYDRVVKFLTKEGFTITRLDSSRLAVFASGTLAQARDTFQVNFSKVTVDGISYPAATSQPSLPTRVAGAVLGINGLQPYHRLHKHSRMLPATADKAPYLINEILTAYDAKNTGYTGAGQTIAILIDTTPKTTDLTKFWTNNSVSQSLSNITTINVNNETLPAVSGEETLDVEWSSGIAPGAKIRVYATGSLSDNDLDNGFARIISDLGSDATIHQLSISLGEGETYETSSELTTDAQYLATIASKGVSTFVSAGDGGSTPDDTGTGDEDTGPLQVEYYSSDVSVTGVGGTSLTLNTSTGARSSETAWAGSGGGVSIKFTKPSWQTGTGVPSGTKRFVPDVCMPADPNTGAYVYLSGSAQQIGGTSWSAPTWAGFCALINQARSANGKGSVGLLNTSLYPLLGTSNFHDITSGSNAEGSKASGKYSATTGYDEVTGVGSPDVGVLLTTLAGSGTATPAPTFANFSPSSGPVGTAVTLNGANFVSVSSVTFNGVSASYTVNSSTQIVVTVPASATTGKITITTATGSVTGGSSFTVTASTTPAPTFSSFSPSTGPVGTSVTLTGANFVSVSSVTFNGVSASFTVNSSTQIVATVPASATTGKITITTATGSVTGGSSFTVTASGSATGLVISQVFGGGGNSGATYTNDFIELFNPTTAAVSLNAFSVQYASATGTSYSLTKLSGSIAAGHYYLVAEAAGTGGTTALPTPDATGSIALSSTAGKVALVSNQTAITSNTSTGVVDFVGFGTTANQYEGSGPAPAPSNTTADVRGNGGRTDTNNNSADFVAGTPNPRNSASASNARQIEGWREQYFASTDNRGDGADDVILAGDGLTNLTKYALGLDPRVSAPQAITRVVSAGRLELSVLKNPEATDVVYHVEVTGTPEDARSWTATDTRIEEDSATGLRVSDNIPAAPGCKRFIRLRVTR